MITEFIRYEGDQNYKKLTYQIDSDRKKHHFNTTFTDVDYPENRAIYEIFADHVRGRQTKFVEVLFSGGVDSEVVLHTCLVNKIPVRAITMRLLVKDVCVNTHDLYYAERFLRNNNVEHKMIDLHIDKFCDNGDHIQYLEPYLIKEFHVATHFWLFEQCTGFPVIGGDYAWPWVGSPYQVISPVRMTYSQYDRFLKDKGIHGIGNMLSHSLESNVLLTKTHVDLINTNNPSYGGMGTGAGNLKRAIYSSLGYTTMEPRLRSYGWDDIHKQVFDKDSINIALNAKYGEWNHSITWGNKLANALGGEPGTWNRFS